MGTRSEFRHGPQVFFLRRRQPVESDAKKTLVECGNSLFGSAINILAGDGRSNGCVPGMFAPFLQKIRIAMGLLQNLIQRVFVHFDFLCSGGLGDCSFRGGWSERTDLWKVKESLGIGFGFAHATSELRQARPYESDWKTTLRAAMQRRNQGRQLRFLDVLQFVDKK